MHKQIMYTVYWMIMNKRKSLTIISFWRIISPRSPSRSFFVLLISTSNVAGEQSKHKTCRSFIMIEARHMGGRCRLYLLPCPASTNQQTKHNQDRHFFLFPVAYVAKMVIVSLHKGNIHSASPLKKEQSINISLAMWMHQLSCEK